MTRMEEVIPVMVGFLEAYCRPGALSDACMRVCEVLDVEESVWAPVFGLKGQVGHGAGGVTCWLADLDVRHACFFTRWTRR